MKATETELTIIRGVSSLQTMGAVTTILMFAAIGCMGSDLENEKAAVPVMLLKLNLVSICVSMGFLILHRKASIAMPPIIASGVAMAVILGSWRFAPRLGHLSGDEAGAVVAGGLAIVASFWAVALCCLRKS